MTLLYNTVTLLLSIKQDQIKLHTHFYKVDKKLWNKLFALSSDASVYIWQG